jgi:tetratricopeptide (TPR) repeat protein/mono/diheme cytochrome c family protein
MEHPTGWRRTIAFAALCLSAVIAVAPNGDPVGAQAPSRAVTFATDIAPIVYAHCASCHRPQGSAPFSLITYADVKSRAERVAEVTRSRYMPPWKPEPGYGDFADARRLSEAQIDLIQRWTAAGAPEGDPAATPSPPAAAEGWQLGTPDLVLTMDRAFTVPDGGDDIYRHFVMPIPVPETRFVRAWELRAGNSPALHHATMEIDRSGLSRHLEMQDPAPGYEGLIAHTTMAPDGYFLDWAPGHTPYRAPEGMAFPIESNSDLVLMLHLRPTGKAEDVRVSVGLYFSDVPPVRVPALLRLTRQDLVIPAGETRYAVTNSFRTPVDLEVFTVQPHAHNLAREIEGVAVLPDGTRKPLLYIRDWDFNWQGVYRYSSPVFLPAGTTVTARWVFDNSEANTKNPNRPPRQVTFGQRTSDEMAELWFQVVPRTADDRRQLTRSLHSHLLPENIKGYEMMIRAEPDNAALHDDVALLYAELGNLDGAAAHFAEAARIRPDSASAHYNLGNTRLLQGRRAEARAAFELAIKADPDYANAHRGLGIALYRDGRFDEAGRAYERALELAPTDVSVHHNFAVLLHAQGRLAEAAARYREALRLDGRYADAHYGLALVFAAGGRTADAAAHYREALRTVPEWPQVMAELAWLLATTTDPALRNPEEAVGLAERALSLAKEPSWTAMNASAAALAAAGRFAEAAERARRAIELAAAAGNDAAAAQIRARLRLYEISRTQ